MYPLRRVIEERLSDYVIDQIRKAPKPTPVAEALAVTKQFRNMGLSTSEIAEIINIVEPYRDLKAKPNDYLYDEMKKHSDLLVTRSIDDIFVRFVGGRALNQ